MAGHYFYDPRPYYGLNMSTNLMPLDELFYKYEPVPYWMDQRMAPMSYPDYHSGHVKQVMTRGPDVQQFLPYNNRPELAARDDIYADTYKRSPHFSGFGPYPTEMRQPRGHSQDDTYLHTMTPQYVNPQSQFPQQGIIPHRGYGAMAKMPVPVPMPMGYMGSNGGQHYMRQGEPVPMQGHMNNQTFPNQRSYNAGEQMDVSIKGNKNSGFNNNGSSNKSYNNDDGYGSKSSMKTTLYNNDNEYSNKATNKSGHKSKQEIYDDDYGSGNKTSKTMYSNDGNHSTKSKGNTKQQHRHTNGDSGSESDDDEYGSGKSGGKWGTKPLLKHGKGDTYSHGKGDTYSNGKGYDNEMGSKSGKSSSSEYQSYGGNTMGVFGSGKKQSGQKHGSQTSKSSSKLGYQKGWDSSSDEDESYAYTKKASKAGQHNQGITKVQHSHGLSGKEQSRGFDSHVQSYGLQQPNHTPFHSQLKSVELKVPICCDNCERKVRACLEYVDGVESVLCDQWQKKVIVYGNAKPDVVLKRVRRVKKASEWWQQAPKRVPVY